MAVLGIESSAHTFGVGLSENGRIIANAKEMYRISDKGMVPSKVAEHHFRNAKRVIEAAIAEAGVGISSIEAVGYTRGPGIGTCLRVGELAALAFARRHNLPIYPVNHAIAHIQITTHLSGMDNPLAVYVSGGNSQIVKIVEKPKRRYHVYGETLDIGVGNMLDAFARAAGLKPAWGSTVANVALGGSYFQMPYTVKGMDFTFTGLLTNAEKSLGLHKAKDVAFSLQETAFSMIAEAAERALLLTHSKGVILCGGVAQSSRLQGILKAMAKSHRCSFFVAPNEFNADNGAMIAYVAEGMHKSGKCEGAYPLGIDQKYRADKVDLLWL